MRFDISVKSIVLFLVGTSVLVVVGLAGFIVGRESISRENPCIRGIGVDRQARMWRRTDVGNQAHNILHQHLNVLAWSQTSDVQVLALPISSERAADVVSGLDRLIGWSYRLPPANGGYGQSENFDGLSFDPSGLLLKNSVETGKGLGISFRLPADATIRELSVSYRETTGTCMDQAVVSINGEKTGIPLEVIHSWLVLAVSQGHRNFVETYLVPVTQPDGV